MSSVWIETRRGNGTKLKGNLSPSQALTAFKAALDGYLKNGWQVVGKSAKQGTLTNSEVVLEKDGNAMYLYVDVQSPSSKPEEGQPRFWGAQGGVVLKKDGLVHLPTPKGPAEAA